MTAGNRFYEEELSYLIEAGREYARVHPERARALNITDPRARDPHVERLLESFAFLTGAVRQRLEDDFPQLTHALLDLVWPHYLRPVPSMAMLEFQPQPGMLREKQTIPRGFLVESTPDADGIACRFRTAYDVDLRPMRLDEVAFSADDAARRTLRLRFTVDAGADLAKMPLDRLRLHLAGEPSEAFGLWRLFRKGLDSIVLRFDKENRRVLSGDRLRSVGFGRDEEILPYPAVSFPGYRLLSEYFAFPDKFLFVDLVDLGLLELPRGVHGFELDLVFRDRPPDSLRPTRESLRLHATPIVNLFPRDGEPILVDHLRTTYRVLGDYTFPLAFEVVSVDAVETIGRQGGDRRSYRPFFSFEHAGATGDEPEPYYHVSHELSPAGGWATKLSLVSPIRRTLPKEETLSLRLTCMNGRLCRNVGVGDVKIPAGERIDFARFANLTRPTDPIYPKLGNRAEWRFISHMALNLLSISGAEPLRGILSLYDTGDVPANRHRIGGVVGARAHPREMLVRGTPIRGTVFEIELDETRFLDEGDLLLFAEVLGEFLSLYASINTFTQLVVRRQPSGEVVTCPPVTGKQGLL